MRLRWTGLRRPGLPEVARPALGSDRPLGWAVDLGSGQFAVATASALYAVSAAGDRLWSRPWHLVDGGSWDREQARLTITWVDRADPTQWRFAWDSDFPEVFRARVQASVVLAETLELPGQRTARVVVRKDLATQGLLTQTILGPGVSMRDPAVSAAVGAALARVREQVGLE